MHAAYIKHDCVYVILMFLAGKCIISVSQTGRAVSG